MLIRTETWSGQNENGRHICVQMTCMRYGASATHCTSSNCRYAQMNQSGLCSCPFLNPREESFHELKCIAEANDFRNDKRVTKLYHSFASSELNSRSCFLEYINNQIIHNGFPQIWPSTMHSIKLILLHCVHHFQLYRTNLQIYLTFDCEMRW